MIQVEMKAQIIVTISVDAKQEIDSLAALVTILDSHAQDAQLPVNTRNALKELANGFQKVTAA